MPPKLAMQRALVACTTITSATYQIPKCLRTLHDAAQKASHVALTNPNAIRNLDVTRNIRLRVPDGISAAVQSGATAARAVYADLIQDYNVGTKLQLASQSSQTPRSYENHHFDQDSNQSSGSLISNL